MRRVVLQVIIRLGIDYDNEYTLYIFGNHQCRRICCVWLGQMESPKVKMAYTRVDADPFGCNRRSVWRVCWHEMFPSQDAA